VCKGEGKAVSERKREGWREWKRERVQGKKSVCKREGGGGGRGGKRGKREECARAQDIYLRRYMQSCTLTLAHAPTHTHAQPEAEMHR